MIETGAGRPRAAEARGYEFAAYRPLQFPLRPRRLTSWLLEYLA
jgi:hypothetical protein